MRERHLATEPLDLGDTILLYGPVKDLGGAHRRRRIGLTIQVLSRLGAQVENEINASRAHPRQGQKSPP